MNYDNYSVPCTWTECFYPGGRWFYVILSYPKEGRGWKEGGLSSLMVKKIWGAPVDIQLGSSIKDLSLLSTNTLALIYDAFGDTLSHWRLPLIHTEPDYLFPSLHSSRSKAWGVDLSIGCLFRRWPQVSGGMLVIRLPQQWVTEAQFCWGPS